MRFGVLVFPGTWSDTDCHHALGTVLGYHVEYVWHKESADLRNRFDCLIIPGGFSYGDYLRAGALAQLSPVMRPLREYVESGRPVMGICNGFQILCEAGLLPGILMRNQHLVYRCQWTNLRVEGNSPFTCGLSQGQVLRIPVSHGEGNYFTDQESLHILEENGQIAFRYCTENGEAIPDANPNGSIANIAGITNPEGNVLGMMPHPERACEQLTGGVDGVTLFQALVRGFMVRQMAQ